MVGAVILRLTWRWLTPGDASRTVQVAVGAAVFLRLLFGLIFTRSLPILGYPDSEPSQVWLLLSRCVGPGSRRMENRPIRRISDQHPYRSRADGSIRRIAIRQRCSIQSVLARSTSTAGDRRIGRHRGRPGGAIWLGVHFSRLRRRSCDDSGLDLRNFSRGSFLGRLSDARAVPDRHLSRRSIRVHPLPKGKTALRPDHDAGGARTNCLAVASVCPAVRSHIDRGLDLGRQPAGGATYAGYCGRDSGGTSAHRRSLEPDRVGAAGQHCRAPRLVDQFRGTV